MIKTAGVSLALLSTTALISAPTAFAQTNDTSFGEDVVISTATRRAENVQDVPIAVTVIQPEDLEKQGVVNIQNLASVAPSFATSNAQIASGSVVLRIRGVGTTSNNIGFESAVGIFIDGAYQSRPGIALSEFVDVERVEVLRGPQGTLFGRNTSAGALNITNVRPDLDEFGGFVNATYGNFDHKSVQGAINIPLAEGKVAARITGAYRERDGYVDIIDRNGDKIGESNSVDQYYLRGQIGFEGEEKFSGRIIVDHSSSDSVCCSALEVLTSPVEAGGVFGLVGLGARGGMAAPNVAANADDDDGAQDAVDDRIATSVQEPNPSSNQTGIVAEIEYELSDNVDIIYIGSYREYDADEEYDSAFSGLDLFNVLDGSELEVQTLTQELRVQGDAFDGRLSWIVGGYYTDETIEQNTRFGLGEDYSNFSDALLFAGTGGLFPSADLINAFGGAAVALPLVSGGGDPSVARTTNRYTQDSKSYSIFTNNTFDVTDQLSLTVGLRYSDESKDGSFSQPEAFYPSCEAQLANFDPATGSFPPAIAPLTGTLTVLGCFPFLAPADNPLAFATPLPLPRTFDDTFEDDELIYTGKIGYEVTPDISTYASFTHGFKSGGFNLDSTAAIGGADPRFASEEVDAYEIGFKSELFDRRLTLNVAGFYEDFDNFQVLEFTGAQFQTFQRSQSPNQGC